MKHLDVENDPTGKLCELLFITSSEELPSLASLPFSTSRSSCKAPREKLHLGSLRRSRPMPVREELHDLTRKQPQRQCCGTSIWQSNKRLGLQGRVRTTGHRMDCRVDDLLHWARISEPKADLFLRSNESQDAIDGPAPVL